jgi:hypothetical protein
MAILLHKGYTIITSATRDKQTGKFSPLASVRWEPMDRSRRVQILTSRKLYFTRDAALEVAVKEALLWIDRQMPAAQTRAQTESITTRARSGEAALQRTHAYAYKESAAQRELVYTARLNVRV